METDIIDPVLVNGPMSCRRGMGSRTATTTTKLIAREKIVKGQEISPRKEETITTPIPTCAGIIVPRAITAGELAIFVCPLCGTWHGKKTGPEQEFYGQLK